MKNQRAKTVEKMCCDSVPKLRPNDKIGLVRISSGFDPEAIGKFINLFTDYQYVLGKTITVYSDLSDKGPKFDLIFDDLYAMTNDDDIRMIYFVNGGHGAQDVINMDLEYKPKIYAGTSDATILLNHISNTFKFVTFLSPVPIHVLTDEGKESLHNMFRILSGVNKLRSLVNLSARVIVNINASNTKSNKTHITGGNLSMIQTMIGLYDEWLNGSLLCVEDIGEDQISIDRKLNHILQVIEPIGLIAGEFIDNGIEVTNDININSIYKTINEYAVRSNIPAIGQYDFSHGRYHLLLPIGAEGYIDNRKLYITSKIVE